jgi:choline transport protein
MTALLIINVTSACISTVATVSRQTWAFARDNGLPFSTFIAHVKPGWNIPLNAILVTFLISAILSLVNIGSKVAFNAIGSLSVTALLGTYIISFTCLVMRRFEGPLPNRRWSLGCMGLFINLGAILFLLMVWVFCFFPISPEVTFENMNWNVVMFCGSMLFAMFYYFLQGWKYYRSPRALVKRNNA